MKHFASIIIALAAGALLTHPLRSQVAGPSRPVREQLQTLKAANEKLLEQQKATLLKLEETQKEAAQLRILVRRT